MTDVDKSGGGEREAPLPVNDPCSGRHRQDSSGASEPVFVSPMMCVEAPQLLAAADQMDGEPRLLRNGVPVTAAQLRKAAEILGEAPQPIANGVKGLMPGFIDREQQPRNGSLVFQVGVLPSRTYRITKRGIAREVAA